MKVVITSITSSKLVMIFLWSAERVEIYNPEENKPGGFFAALDKMERGELDQGKSEDQHTDERALNVIKNVDQESEDVDQKSEELKWDKKKLPSTQCKMTDFFVVK